MQAVRKESERLRFDVKTHFILKRNCFLATFSIMHFLRQNQFNCCGELMTAQHGFKRGWEVCLTRGAATVGSLVRWPLSCSAYVLGTSLAHRQGAEKASTSTCSGFTEAAWRLSAALIISYLLVFCVSASVDRLVVPRWIVRWSSIGIWIEMLFLKLLRTILAQPYKEGVACYFAATKPQLQLQSGHFCSFYFLKRTCNCVIRNVAL